MKTGARDEDYNKEIRKNEIDKDNAGNLLDEILHVSSLFYF